MEFEGISTFISLGGTSARLRRRFGAISAGFPFPLAGFGRGPKPDWQELLVAASAAAAPDTYGCAVEMREDANLPSGCAQRDNPSGSEGHSLRPERRGPSGTRVTLAHAARHASDLGRTDL